MWRCRYGSATNTTSRKGRIFYQNIGRHYDLQTAAAQGPAQGPAQSEHTVAHRPAESIRWPVCFFLEHINPLHRKEIPMLKRKTVLSFLLIAVILLNSSVTAFAADSLSSEIPTTRTTTNPYEYSSAPDDLCVHLPR